MSGSTSILDLLSTSQSSKEDVANVLLNAFAAAGLFAKRDSTTTGLTWGYFGGPLIVDGAVTQIANGTVSLTASTTNYVEATAAGVVSASLGVFTAGRIPLYTVVTSSSGITSWVDYRITNLRVPGLRSIAIGGSPTGYVLSNEQAQCRIIEFTGVLTENETVTVPTIKDWWIVKNGTTGNFTLTVKTAAGSGGEIEQGSAAIVYCDGTNVVSVASGGGGGAMDWNQETDSYTLALTDAGNAVAMNKATANILTIPANSTVPFAIGTSILVYQEGAGQTSIAPAVGVTLRNRTTGSPTFNAIAGQYGVISLIKRDTDEWVMSGDAA